MCLYAAAVYDMQLVPYELHLTTLFYLFFSIYYYSFIAGMFI